MASKDRFDLEQNIMHCWHVVDDLDLIVERDNVSIETVRAISTLYKQRFECLWENFENCCANQFGYSEKKSIDNFVDRSEEARKAFNDALTDIDIAKQNLNNGMQV